MKQLKALIGKTNIEKTITNNWEKDAIFVIVPGDNDYVSGYSPGYFKDIKKYFVIDSFSIGVFIRNKKDKNTIIYKYLGSKDVTDLWDYLNLLNSDDLSRSSARRLFRKLTEKDEQKFKSITEALIDKKNIKNIVSSENDLYLVDPFNDYFDYFIKNFPDKEVSGFFIVTKDDITTTIKSVGKQARIKDHLKIYPLIHLKESEIKNLRKDLLDEDMDFRYIKYDYVLNQIDIDSL